MSIIKFSSQNNDTWIPKREPQIFTNNEYLSATEKHDLENERIKRIKELLEKVRKYDEEHRDMSKRLKDPYVRGSQVATLGTAAAGVRVPRELQEVIRDYIDLLDMNVWEHAVRGEVGRGRGSRKKSKKTKRKRRPTKRRR